MSVGGSFSKDWNFFARRFPGIGKRATIVLAVVLAAAGCRPAPDPNAPVLSAEVRGSTNRARIGDAVRVELVAEHPERTTLRIEAPIPETLSVLARDPSERRIGKGRVRTTLRYDLQAFTAGTYTALVGRVSLSGEGSGAVTAEVAGVVFQVDPIVAAAGKDPVTEPWRELPGPGRGPGRRFSRLLWALPLVALVALAVGRWSRRLGRLKPPEEPASHAPHELALRELEQLRGEDWLGRGEWEAFVVRLSDIVRRYLEGRFDLKAPEQTTEEFIREATLSSRLSTEHQRLTQSFLEQSDLVKFARWRPDPAVLREAFSAAERLVRETAPDAAGPAPDGKDGP